MRIIKAIWWWLGEIVGEHEYEKYVAHLQLHHPDQTAPTEREYFRMRYAEKAANPGARCC